MRGIYFFLAVSWLGAPLLGDEAQLPDNQRCLIYGEADYLLLFVNQDGLSYATVSEGNNCLGTLSLSDKDEFLKPGWNSGGRVLMGVQPGPVHWDTNVAYLFYFANAKNSVETSSYSLPGSSAGCFSTGDFILSDATFDLFEGFPGPLEFSSSGKWKLFFNRIDWEFGRNILCGSDFTFRPFFGVEVLGLYQQLHQETDGIYLSTEDGLPVTDRIEVKNKGVFWGAGSKAGFNGEFHLGKGFGFYGSVAGSILWGHFHLNQDFTQFDYYLDGSSTNVGGEFINHSHNASIFNCDLAIGFDWKYLIRDGKSSVGAKFGWEEHFYTNMNRFQNFVVQDISSSGAVYAFDRNLQKGNLTLSGFTFAFLFNY